MKISRPDILYAPVSLLLHGMALLPMWVLYGLSDVLYVLIRYVVRYRVKVVRRNIGESFPEMSVAECRRTERRFYRHFADYFVETIKLLHISDAKVRQMMEFVNVEEVDRSVAAGRSVAVYAGHYANWELLFGFEHFALPEGSADSYAFKRSNVAMVYKKLNSPLWDEIFRECRLRLLGTDFENYIESAGILRHVVEHHGDGYFYMFDTDQRPYANAKAVMDVEFMGQPAQTMYAGAGVAHKYGLAVSYLSMTRKPSGKGYLCELKTICDDASKMEVQQIMDEFYRLLEADIRKDPGEYLWSHKRWKLVNKNTK